MIDDHCHPFSLRGGPLDPSTLTLDMHPDPDRRRGAVGPTRVSRKLLAMRLARRFDCGPTPPTGRSAPMRPSGAGRSRPGTGSCDGASGSRRTSGCRSSCTPMNEAWEGVAGRLREAGARESWVEHARALVFEQNARDLYRI